jgi:glycosyltransferase involved in cell wall biosynthesis
MQENIDSETSRYQYDSKDLAIIIPTKDRPKEVERLLKSICELDCKVGRIIVVASGQDIHNVVMAYSEKLNVEYFSSESGQIKQRNMGISLLDDSTKLVATMDDDAFFYKTAVSEMILFWNSVEPQTAGVGFNIVNQKRHKHNWLRGLLGVSVPEPGRVLKSGNCTSISNVKENIRCEWLNGGGTVWRQDILLKYPHAEIKSNWAVCEDVIYSYPKSKKYPLYVCHNSKINIEDVAMLGEKIELYRYRGKTTFLWTLYFVLSNKELSIVHFIFFRCLQMTALFIYGLFFKDKFRSAFATGMFTGLAVIPIVQFNKHKIIKYIEEKI